MILACTVQCAACASVILYGVRRNARVENVYIINQINNWTNVRACRAYMRKTTTRSKTIHVFKYAVRFPLMLVKLSIWVNKDQGL